MQLEASSGVTTSIIKRSMYIDDKLQLSIFFKITESQSTKIYKQLSAIFSFTEVK